MGGISEKWPDPAQKAFDDRNFALATYLGAGEVHVDSGDREVVRLAASLQGIGEEALAVELLRKCWTDSRGGNYRLALVSALYRAGDFLEAVRVPRDDGDTSQFEPAYRLDDIRAHLRAGKFARARDLIRANGEALVDGPYFWPLVESLIRWGSAELDDCAADFATRYARSRDLSPHESDVLAVFAARQGIDQSELGNVNPDLHREALGVFERFPLDQELRLLAEHESAHPLCSSEDFRTLVTQAVCDSKPFSYVRLGDGEGRFLSDLSGYPLLASRSRSISERVWFWNSRPGVHEVVREHGLRAIDEADILGINGAFRLTLEFRNSLEGYLGVVLANRLAFSRRSPRSTLCVNWILKSMEKEGTLEGMLQAHELSAIWPYEARQLRGRVLRESLRIPAEGHEVWTGRSLDEPHWPDAFDRVSAELTLATPGLWLVAGGIFGKIYCAVAREAGHVALDIGSLADEWMGLRTR